MKIFEKSKGFQPWRDSIRPIRDLESLPVFVWLPFASRIFEGWLEVRESLLFEVDIIEA